MSKVLYARTTTAWQKRGKWSKGTAATQTFAAETHVTGLDPYEWNYGPEWKRGTDDIYTDVPNVPASVKGKAVRIRLVAVKDVNAGIIRVKLNGVVVNVNLYQAFRQANVVVWDSGVLADQQHTLEVDTIGDKDPASTGRFVNSAKALFDVTGPLPTVSPDPEQAPPTVGTRDPWKQPYRGSWTSGAPVAAWSIWNTPIGSNAKLVSAGLKYAGASGGGKITRDPFHIGYPTDAQRTLTTREEGRAPWVGGGSAQVLVAADDTGPGTYSGGNHLAWFPVATDTTRGWTGHPLGLTAGGHPSVGYMDPHDAPDDLYGQGHRGSHGGSHMSGLPCVRQWEWDALNDDVIQHAIPVNLYAALYLFYDTILKTGKRWPANSQDRYAPTGYKGTNPAMKIGALLTLPANYNWQGVANLQARKIIRAFWAFGFYVVDDSAWDVHQIGVERKISLSAQSLTDFHKPIMDAFIASLVVDNNSPTSVGGGGIPRVPLVSDIVRV